MCIFRKATNCNSEHTKLERDGVVIYTIWRGYGNRSPDDLFDQTEINVRYRKISNSSRFFWKPVFKELLIIETSRFSSTDWMFDNQQGNVKGVEPVSLFQKSTQMLRTVKKEEPSASIKLSFSYLCLYYLPWKLSVSKQRVLIEFAKFSTLVQHKKSLLQHALSAKYTTRKTLHLVFLKMELTSNSIIVELESACQATRTYNKKNFTQMRCIKCAKSFEIAVYLAL